ncbi:MAG: RNA polymerase sigma-54 factor [[Chlorobium] sp. 445]|nr:MAG: RNA polymerase sigma-54 factor [[Chlorobium] sp. 445]
MNLTMNAKMTASLLKKILTYHYTEFTMMHYQKLMQTLGVTQNELRRAVQLIQKLNPKPIRNSSERVKYIVPDFIVTFDGDELVVSANERNIPQIRISRRYKEILEDKRQDRSAREFIRQKIEAAKGFMSAIEMRRHTMRKIMDAIVRRQYEFFAVGPEKLKPMILKDIAEEAGVDISTVSRVVNGKYVQTDKGIWELKYFFSTAVETESGDEISNRIIKQFIKDFIEKEESGKPLSDDKLAEMLAQHGYKVARRTVTKYREQLNIPVARLRKKIEATG